MNTVELLITEEARTKLLRDIARITEYEAIATVVWSESGSYVKHDNDGNEIGSGSLPPCWSVGFYKPSQTCHLEIHTISGIKFAFDQGSISQRLNGKVLDIENGHYHIRER